MSQQATGWIGLQIEGTNETFWALPAPDDERRLAEILRKGTTTVSIAQTGDDVEGHAESGDVTLDVEGHALTLRLRSPADAAVLRRRLAVGALTATLIVAGAAAALNAPGAPTAAVESAGGASQDEGGYLRPGQKPEPR